LSINITSRHTGSGDVENGGVGDVVFVGAEKMVFRQTLLALREIQIRSPPIFFSYKNGAEILLVPRGYKIGFIVV